MKATIKRVLREQTDEELIARRDRMYVRIEKVLPNLVDFLRQYLKEYNLYDITVTDSRTAYGTWTKNEITGKSELYSGDIKIITLRFVGLSEHEKRKVRSDVFNSIEDMFGIPILQYMIPLDITYINLEEKKF
jgi:hypothetical protein